MSEETTTDAADRPIRITQTGALVVITLDRPNALNALNDAMRSEIAACLPGYMRDPSVYAVALRSTDARAFCAGGDVRELRTYALGDLAGGIRSLADEYRLNWLLDCFNKPTISFINGLCFGSGVGLTLYNTHRVAGENYAFAMPECGIGLFPDLGVCHVLARLPDRIGVYLGLTGRRIGPADAYGLGLVTHCISSSAHSAIQDSLADAEPVDRLLDAHHADPGEPELQPFRALIGDVFAAANVEEIVAGLQAVASADAHPHAGFCASVLDDLRHQCPVSLKLTLRHIRDASRYDLRETLEQDHRLAGRCLAGPNFVEGVRALLIDKDRQPIWSPATLEEVDAESVAAYFEAGDRDDEWLVLRPRDEMQRRTV